MTQETKREVDWGMIHLDQARLRSTITREESAQARAAIAPEGAKPPPDARGITPLRDGSIALGMMPKLPFLKSGTAELPTNSTLLCYTDGLVEQEDASGTAFETATINGILSAGVRSTAKAINEAVINAFETHRSGLPYLDDIALLTCRFA